MIKELQKKHDKVEMYVMYDVACMLHKHLEVCASMYKSYITVLKPLVGSVLEELVRGREAEGEFNKFT